MTKLCNPHMHITRRTHIASGLTSSCVVLLQARASRCKRKGPKSLPDSLRWPPNLCPLNPTGRPPLRYRQAHPPEVPEAKLAAPPIRPSAALPKPPRCRSDPKVGPLLLPLSRRPCPSTITITFLPLLAYQQACCLARLPRSRAGPLHWGSTSLSQASSHSLRLSVDG